MAIYKIHESLMEGLEKKVSTIRRKCEKYGCDFKFEQVGEEYVKMVDDNKVPFTTRFVLVDAEGTAQMNGWQFVASIEHTPNGNLIKKALTDIEVPTRFWTSDTYCEHCNTRRMRKGTLLVRNEETGEFKQVGHSCIRDYTCGMDADWAAFMASLTDVFAEEEAKGFGGLGSGFTAYFDVTEILQYTAEMVKAFGYKKRYDENGNYNPDNTAQAVEDFYAYFHCGRLAPKKAEAIREMVEEVSFDAESDYAKETAKSALNWLAEQDESSDYIHNLKVVVANEYIAENKFGILCSLIPCYNRAVEKVEKQKKIDEENAKVAKIAEYIGNVGDRLTIEVTECKCISSWDTDFGTTYLYKFSDSLGNVFMWRTGNYIDTEKVTKVTGTIKEHSEYKGIKQNIITRCKVA